MGIFSLSWQMVGMWGIAILLLYLGVAKQYEPLLMVPIAFGALIANIPDNGMLITQLNQQVISSNEQGEVTTWATCAFMWLLCSRRPPRCRPI